MNLYFTLMILIALTSTKLDIHRVTFELKDFSLIPKINIKVLKTVDRGEGPIALYRHKIHHFDLI